MNLITLPVDVDIILFRFLDLKTALKLRSCANSTHARYSFARPVLWSTVKPSDFSYVIDNTVLSLVKPLSNIFDLTIEDVRSDDGHIFRMICYRSYFEVAQWIVKEFKLTAADARSGNNYALLTARNNGHLPVAQWLTEAFNLE